MNNQSIERGYPLIADISGFVPFITKSEMEHASEIIQELLDLIAKKIQSIFKIVQIDGDAIFAYTSQNTITRGEILFELLESTYNEYKDQLLQISRNRTCGCNACSNASTLDLKFAIHFGEYIPNEFQKQFDLIGLAPYFIRKREWKQPVKESLDWRGYALFTQDCLTQLGFQPDDLNAIQIPGGSIQSFGLNLEVRYKSMLEHRRVVISKEDALYSVTKEFPLPPALLWDWINDPDKRTQWYILKWTSRQRIGGRTDSGAVNHCNHGLAGDSLETILDWRPFEYFTSEYHIRPFNIHIKQTTSFILTSDGNTQLNLNIRPADNSIGWITKPTCWMFAAYVGYALNRLRSMAK